MMLPAPRETGPQNWLSYYLDLGINCIPLGVGDKRPYLSILGDSGWKPYQSRKVSHEQVMHWHGLASPGYGVALIGGKVSGGLVCLDADNQDFAAWLLDHRDESLFNGVWLVETGSGRAHVWVRTHTPPQIHGWFTNAHAKVGEVRGEGSYAVAPPSTHPSGGTYVTRAGAPDRMRLVEDVEVFARQLVEAFQAENPGSTAQSPNGRGVGFFEPDKEQTEEIYSRVKAANFKRKIRDTLIKPGCYTPGEGYWDKVTSHSDVDFALVCEMQRVGWSQDEAEWIFAGCLAAVGCYANKYRHGSKGHAYWDLTWNKAQAQVAQENVAKRLATGANFKVLEAVQMGRDEPRYKLRIETMGNAGGEKVHVVAFTVEDLTNMQRFKNVCIRRTGWQPRFTTGQRGNDFEQFTDAVLLMVSDTISIPNEFSTTGNREEVILQQLRLCAPRAPREAGELTLGWVDSGAYYVVGLHLYHALRADDRRITNEQYMDTLYSMAHIEDVTHRFDDGSPIRVLRVQLKNAQLWRALSPPDAALDGS